MQQKIITFLEQAQIKFVRYIWCGNNNLIRGKAVHKNRLEAYFNNGIAFPANHQASSVIADFMVNGSGLPLCEQVHLVADWDTLTVLPYATGHARVIADILKNGQPWFCCPRYFLKRMIEAAAREDLEIMGAFENEFFLLKSSEEHILPAYDMPKSGSTFTMDLQYKLINEISDALIAQGVQVEFYYPESGPGHQEISVLYTNALSAADQQIIFRETVKAIAAQYNLIASFLPKIYEELEGNGCHLHLSLWRNGKNILPDGKGELSEITKYFMAGLLEHLPALMALIAPSPNSYRRIQPDLCSGAYTCWGFNNREAAIRVPTHPAPQSPTHFELKTVDASANPYLALGGVIAAGLDGIRRKLPLGEPLAVNPGALTESELEKQNIYRLPTNLEEAIEALEQDEVLLTALGPELAQSYIAVKQTEWHFMKDFSLDKEVRLLLERY